MADGTSCVLPTGSPRPGAPSVPPQEEGAAAALEAPDDLSSPRSISGSSAGTSRDNSAERDPPVFAKAAPAAGIMKNALVSFKELCGLTPAANIKQCILKLATWLQPSEKNNPPTVTLNLGEEYPSMETQGPVPELLRKVLAAYDTMIQTSRTLIESADAVHAKIIQVQQAGVSFHKELHRLEAKEGLKGRKLQKALESFAWNITVLKGQADLLKHSKTEALDTLWQIHNAAQSCGIGRNGAASPDLFRNRAVLDPIPEAEGVCEPGSS